MEQLQDSGGRAGPDRAQGCGAGSERTLPFSRSAQSPVVPFPGLSVETLSKGGGCERWLGRGAVRGVVCGRGLDPRAGSPGRCGLGCVNLSAPDFLFCKMSLDPPTPPTPRELEGQGTQGSLFRGEAQRLMLCLGRASLWLRPLFCRQTNILSI